MELGGKNPQIVFPDADMEAALDAAVFGAYFNAGECCNAGSRLMLHRDIAGEFVAALVERSREVKVGDPLDEGTKVGAIISADHLGKDRGLCSALPTGRREIAPWAASASTSAAASSWRRPIVASVEPDMAHGARRSVRAGRCPS